MFIFQILKFNIKDYDFYFGFYVYYYFLNYSNKLNII